ncbi:hypothetical protein CRP7_gp18 [Roseobacter phage CRP-7]|nr:hypothetical protein CRP7_gp18 [Roseobacter phage CRP-7]
MNYKLHSLYNYKDFPVSWEVLPDETTVIITDLFDLSVNHEINHNNISEVVDQILVELYSDVITFH